MKKIFNFRPIFLAFVGFFVGAYFSVDVLFSSTFIKILLALLIVICLCFSFIKISFFKLRKIAIWVLCGSLIFGFSYSALKIKNYNNNQISKNISVVGIVSDQIIKKSGYSTVVLKNIYSPQAEISGKMRLNIYGDISEAITTGDEIYFNSNVESYKIISADNEIKSSIEKTNCKYYAGVNIDKISIQKGKASFFENIRINSRKNILKNTSSEEMGNLIYSIIFGDKTYLSSEMYENFSLAGAAHLLAVSGLHVGFIVALLLFVLKLFKANKYVKTGIVFVFLIIYNILCGFSPSIVRSSIMTVVLLLSYLFGEKNDMLTSLGIAGILILLFKPLMVFDIGFQLSFGALFGIICLVAPLNEMFKKAKIPNVLSESFAVCLAANIGTIPFVGLCFKSFAYIGLISNLIIIPIFGVVFCFSFLVFLIGLIVPFVNGLFGLAEIGFVIVYKICKIFALVTSFKIAKVGIILLIIYPVIILVSNFSFLKKYIKKAIAFLCVAILCFSFSIAIVPTKNTCVFASKLEQNAVILASQKNEILIVSEEFENYEISDAQNYLSKNNLENSLIGVVITGEAKDMKEVYSFASNNKNVDVFITTNCFIDLIDVESFENVKILDRELNCGSFCLNVFMDFETVCAIEINYNSFNVVCLNSLSAQNIEFLNQKNIKTNVVFCNKFKNVYNNLTIDFENFVANSSSDVVNLKIYLTNNQENYIIKQKVEA